VNFLNIREAAVQEFIWAHLVPTDIRHDYTKADAIKYVCDAVVKGEQWLVGDMEGPLAFRCALRNPRILECHIMGNALRLRTLLPAALELAWRNSWNQPAGVERIVLLTAFEPLIGICTRLGFTHEATLPRAHWDGAELQPLHIITMERP
jgi:hypothetical protein